MRRLEPKLSSYRKNWRMGLQIQNEPLPHQRRGGQRPLKPLTGNSMPAEPLGKNHLEGSPMATAATNAQRAFQVFKNSTFASIADVIDRSRAIAPAVPV